eukprot:SAG11_NODE_5987_length_1418_cov_1.055345_2_plen_57_part_00
MLLSVTAWYWKSVTQPWISSASDLYYDIVRRKADTWISMYQELIILENFACGESVG